MVGIFQPAEASRRTAPSSSEPLDAPVLGIYRRKMVATSSRRLRFKISNQTYIRTYIQACIHTYRQTHIQAYMHTYIHTYIQAYIQACIHTYIYTGIHTYIHACMHAYIHI